MEVLEDDGEEKDVGLKVEVMVVTEACAAEAISDPFSVGVDAIGEALAGELAV